MPKTLAPLLTALMLTLAAPAPASVSPAQPAPDFTLRKLSGGNLRLAEQRGQVVMVNFWATWCGPCRVELPHLQRLHDKYRSAGFVLLGVNVDDQAAAGQHMAQRMGLTFPVLHDADKAVTRRYDVGAMPGTVLIDRDGTVRHLHRGYRDGMERQYEEQIRALLKE
jgi:peroxiredoxin